MLSRCLNPGCDAPFRYLQEGRIFNIERVVVVPGAAEPQRLVDHYWLCARCSMTLKVVVENGRITTVPIRRDPSSAETAEELVPAT